MKSKEIKNLAVSAVCLALCVVFPMLFHSIPNGGSIFLPMHIPVLLCGLLCGGIYGGICGAAGPLISSLATGMPPMAMLPSMMTECFTYGLVAGFLIKSLKGKAAFKLYFSLVSAMLLGRVVSGLVSSYIFMSGNSPFAWIGASLLTGLPGIAAQLLLVPLLYFGLKKAGLAK